MKMDREPHQTRKAPNWRLIAMAVVDNLVPGALFLSIALDVSFYIQQTFHLYLHDILFMCLAVITVVGMLKSRPLPQAELPLSLRLFFGYLFINLILAALLRLPALPNLYARIFLFEHLNALRILGVIGFAVWLVASSTTTRHDITRLLRLLFWAATLAVTLQIIEFGLLGRPHVATTPLDLVLPFSLVLGVVLWESYRSRRQRVVLSLALVCNIVGLNFLFSRSAIMGLVAAWGILLVGDARKRVWLGAVTVLAVVLLGAIAPSAMLTRAVSIVKTSILAYTIPSRLAIWKDALTIGTGSPWFGVGYANYVLQSSVTEAKDAAVILEGLFSDTIKSAHNLYLNLFAETGVVGVVLFLFAVGSLLRRAFIDWRAARDPWERAVSTFFLSQVVAVMVMNLTGEFLIPRTPAWVGPSLLQWFVFVFISKWRQVRLEPTTGAPMASC